MIRFLLLAVLLGAVTGARQDDRVARLKWMSGCWVRATPRFTMEEQWTVPRGGTMFGIGRTTRRLVSADSVSEHEFTQIHAVNGKLIFSAHPSGQQPADFTESELTDSSVVFSNPQHDFPQNVRYMKGRADSLYAAVDGIVGGSKRRADFRYARTSCEKQ
jgi:hypothetical protein